VAAPDLRSGGYRRTPYAEMSEPCSVCATKDGKLWLLAVSKQFLPGKWYTAVCDALTYHHSEVFDLSPEVRELVFLYVDAVRTLFEYITIVTDDTRLQDLLHDKIREGESCQHLVVAHVKSMDTLPVTKDSYKYIYKSTKS